MEKRLKTKALLFLFFLLSPFLISAQVSIGGYDKEPIRIKADASTGLNEIIVVNSVKGLTISYESADGREIEWSEYSSMGAGYAQEVDGLQKDGRRFILSDPHGNRGYVIKDSATSYAFWLVDYSSFPLVFSQLDFSDDSGCDSTVLNFSGEATAIDYYTINGKREILSRDIKLSYTTLVWNQEAGLYIEEEVVNNLPYLNKLVVVSPAVLNVTKFEISGDRFIEFWEKRKILESDYYTPVAVAVTATVGERYGVETDNSNQIGSSDVELGGSAPFTAQFLSHVTDAVIHFEWQFASDPEFVYINNRFYEQDLTYTFTEEGTTYIRFVGSNSNGSCEAYSDSFEVSIGASELKVPNAFSPNGDGINDIWKVSYRSLIEFKCWIFDRHGHKIFYFDDPSDGWDGKNGTKFVNSGVYYYVIEALGADGKKYKKSGDINILNSKEYNPGTYID